jgi:hypothetical protein
MDTKLTKWNMVQLKQIMTSSGISKWSQKKNMSPIILVHSDRVYKAIYRFVFKNLPSIPFLPQ